MRLRSRHQVFTGRPFQFTCIVICAGIIARIAEFSKCHSLSEDEIFLALNIAQRNYADLLMPLSFDQIAPVGFLWLERLMVQVFGVSEYSLRLVPLLSGIAALPLVWIAANKFCGPWPAVLAAALVSVSPGCIRYASQDKQYGVEMFVTAALLGAAAYWPERVTGRRTVGLICIGLFAISLSNPAIYVLSGLGLLLAVRAFVRRAPTREWLFLGGVAFTWLTFFGVLYIVLFAPQLGPGTYMDQFWGPARLLAQPNVVVAAKLVFRSTLYPVVALEERVPLALYIAAGVLFVGGALFSIVARKAVFRREIAFLGLIPLLLALLSAIPGKWVFAHRLMMFSVPLTVLLMTAAISWTEPWLQKSVKAQAMFVAGCSALLLFPAKADVYSFRHEDQSLRSGVEFGLKQYRPGDTVYLYSRAVSAWLFYSTDWYHPDRERLAWMTDASRMTGPNGGNIQSRLTPIQNEGFGLRRSYRDGGVEIVGVGDGIFHSGAGAQQHGPDPGWVENEVARVCREFRNNRMILVGLRPGVRGVPDLLSYFRGLGARIIAEYRGESAIVSVMKVSCH